MRSTRAARRESSVFDSHAQGGRVCALVGCVFLLGMFAGCGGGDDRSDAERAVEAGGPGELVFPDGSTMDIDVLVLDPRAAADCEGSARFDVDEHSVNIDQPRVPSSDEDPGSPAEITLELWTMFEGCS
jgi:hypothetical protein